jgi:hypothetical protein
VYDIDMEEDMHGWRSIQYSAWMGWKNLSVYNTRDAEAWMKKTLPP